jgi:hypothetical protein
MQLAREQWLKHTKPEADMKLRQLGIPLDYVVEFRTSGSEVDDDNVVKLTLGDRFGPNWRDKSALNLILHELAHVFFNKYVRKQTKILDAPETRSLFGDLVKTYKRKPGPKKEQPFYYTKYAQSHPEEEFAEVFALYTKHDGDMGKIRHHLRLEGKAARVYKQVEWMDRLIRSVAGSRRTRI